MLRPATQSHSVTPCFRRKRFLVGVRGQLDTARPIQTLKLCIQYRSLYVTKPMSKPHQRDKLTKSWLQGHNGGLDPLFQGC